MARVVVARVEEDDAAAAEDAEERHVGADLEVVRPGDLAGEASVRRARCAVADDAGVADERDVAGEAGVVAEAQGAEGLLVRASAGDEEMVRRPGRSAAADVR